MRHYQKEKYVWIVGKQTKEEAILNVTYIVSGEGEVLFLDL